MTKQQISALRAFAERHPDSHTIHVQSKYWTVERGQGYFLVDDIAEFQAGDWGCVRPLALEEWALTAKGEQIYVQAMELSGERFECGPGFLVADWEEIRAE